MWGNQVVIPEVGRAEVLQELHDSHPGETRMKRLARMFVWWPGMDQEIVNVVKSCVTCLSNRFHGSGLLDHGVECILILLDQLRTT